MENLVIFFRDQQLDHAPAEGFRPPLRRAARPSRRALGSRPSRGDDHPRRRQLEVRQRREPGTPTCPATPSRRWAACCTCACMPEVGGDTLFANMYAAFEALSAPMQRLLAGLTAMHDGEGLYRGRYGTDDRGKIYPQRRASGHPHPSGDRPAGAVRQLLLHDPDQGADQAARATPCWPSCSGTSRRRNSPAASAGRRTRSRSGTTAPASTRRSGTTSRTRAAARG